MIREKDFRIDNWVIADSELLQIDRIFSGGTLQLKDKIGNYGISSIEGIPLTPEILLKCGFVLDEDEGDKVWYRYPHHNNKYHEQNDHECWVFAIVHSDGSYTDLIYDKDHFQFLHHLQNLFYTLTKDELEFKP